VSARPPLSEATRVVASRELASSEVDGEAVILGLSEGSYYGLDPVGTRIWQLVQEPRTVAELRDTITREYDVESERCLGDLLSLLAQLEDADLIVRSSV